jgi:hypothetical protein
MLDGARVLPNRMHAVLLLLSSAAAAAAAAAAAVAGGAQEFVAVLNGCSRHGCLLRFQQDRLKS